MIAIAAPVRNTRAGSTHAALTALVASVWLFHGLGNKLFGLSPRHLAIVQSVPGLDGARGELLLMLVGIGEVILAAWVISGWLPRVCAAVQTVALLAMNVLELTYAKHLLISPVGLLPINIVFLAIAWRVALRASIRPSVITRLLAIIRTHPFPVVADFADCLVLTYAFPRRALERILPRGLALDTLGDQAFVAVAVVDTRRLRPAGFPKQFGRDFVLAGYRIFVRYRTPEGRTMRGLYILRSDANRRAMVALGNVLTHYNYHKASCDVCRDGDVLDIGIRTRDSAGDLRVRATVATSDASRSTAIFPTPQDARRFAGPMPYTFDVDDDGRSLIVIKGIREHWEPTPVKVSVSANAFIDALELQLRAKATLASAFHIGDVAYRWERGVRLPINGDRS